MERLIDLEWLVWVLSMLTGYLLGSISFARIVTKVFSPSGEVKRIVRDIPGTDMTFDSDAVTATTVNLQLGPRFGCLTSLLDMVKAAVPTGLFLYSFPNKHYFLAAAIMTMIGHNYPIYYRFKGGRGLSPLIGALMVINWFSLLLSGFAALLLAYLTGAILAMRWSWMGFLVIWFALYLKDPWYVAFMLAANFLFFFSMRKELASAIKIGKNRKTTQEEISEFMLMGKELGRFIDKYGLPALIRKVKK